MQFLYPSGGLNWLQGENGPLGLPDIRAQAGFVSEDGRYFNLEGSGTENVSEMKKSFQMRVELKEINYKVLQQMRFYTLLKAA